jgi:tetratricopeptide (TPR) repeat protein
VSTTTGSSTTQTDAHGNPMNGSRHAVDLYDETLDRLLRFDVAVLDLAGRLADEAADAPMAQVMLAYLSLMSTDPADVPAARDCTANLRAMSTNPREAAHLDAIDAWCAGDWAGVSARLDDVLVHHPADLLALMIGHQLDFFLGDQLNLRDRVCRSLPNVDPAHPHHGFVLGMQAFGLEEAGSYHEAEEAGRAALAVHPDDVWAVHAVVHVLEMQGRVDDGIAFMVERRADWAEGNMFTVHNWWHLALYLLEAGRHDLVLAIYDREIHHAGAAGVPIELLDASALLWRLRLDGVDIGDRFAALADVWALKATDEPWYVFNDLHSTMALVGAGRLPEARAVVARLDEYVDGAGGTNASMTAEIGLPACRAVIAHGEGRSADVVAALAPIRRRLPRLGGSHAQRDVLQRTLLDATIQAGEHDVARSLLDERITLRPSSVFGWDRRARLFASTGAASASTAAATTAALHRDRFAAAALGVEI